MYVYVIKANTNPPTVKIGISRKVNERLQSLQTANPFKLEIVGSLECESQGHARQIEAEYHQRLDKQRASGEWFLVCPETEAQVADLLARTPVKAKLFRRKQKTETLSDMLSQEVKEKSLMTIKAASDKYRLDIKRLRGAIHRNTFRDPIGCIVSGYVYDNKFLHQYAKANRLPHDAGDSQ